VGRGNNCQQKFFTERMDFTTTVIDFAKYNDGDLVQAALAQAPGLSVWMSSALRNLKSTSDLDNVKLLVNTPSIATQAYTYVTTKATRATKLQSQEVLTYSLVKGGEIRPVHKIAAPMLAQGGDILIDDFVTLVSGKTVENLVDIPALEVNTRVANAGTEGVAIRFTNDIYVAPTVCGDPLFDNLGTAFLEKEGVDVTLVRSKEVVTAHTIVDLVRLNKGILQPKKVPEALGTLEPQDLKKMEQVCVTVTRLFTGALANKNSLKGRPLMKAVLQAMVDSRDKAGYQDFLTEVSSWAQKPRKVRLPKKIGEYKQEDLEYAITLLERTRGIRGGDDSESTSLGLSSYLDFNVDRSVVKHLARATDISNILRIMGGSTFISFIGSGANAYVHSLLLINANVKKIGVSNVNLPGWKMDAANSSWIHPLYKPIIVTEIGGIVFNTELLDPQKEKMLEYESEYVQATKCPIDYKSGRFIPSCLVHNLTGWLLPKGKKDEQTIKLMPNYFRVANVVNVVRTYPSLFQADRTVEYLRKSRFPTISFSLYTRLVQTVRAGEFTDLFMSSGGEALNIFDCMDNEHKAAILKAVATAERDVEDDQDYDVVSTNDADEEDDDGEDPRRQLVTIVEEKEYL